MPRAGAQRIDQADFINLLKWLMPPKKSKEVSDEEQQEMNRKHGQNLDLKRHLQHMYVVSSELNASIEREKREQRTKFEQTLSKFSDKNDLPTAFPSWIQKRGIMLIKENLEKSRKTILAYSMGLGKTLTVLCSIYFTYHNTPDNVRVIILCPTEEIKNQWEMQNSKFKKQSNISFEYCTNTLSIGHQEDDRKKKVILVVDEAHKKYQQGTTYRSFLERVKRTFMQNVQNKNDCSFVMILMTGTPITNHYKDIVSLLKLSDTASEDTTKHYSQLESVFSDAEKIIRISEPPREFLTTLQDFFSYFRLAYSCVMDRHGPKELNILINERAIDQMQTENIPRPSGLPFMFIAQKAGLLHLGNRPQKFLKWPEAANNAEMKTVQYVTNFPNVQKREIFRHAVNAQGTYSDNDMCYIPSVLNLFTFVFEYNLSESGFYVMKAAIKNTHSENDHDDLRNRRRKNDEITQNNGKVNVILGNHSTGNVITNDAKSQIKPAEISYATVRPDELKVALMQNLLEHSKTNNEKVLFFVEYADTAIMAQQKIWRLNWRSQGEDSWQEIDQEYIQKNGLHKFHLRSNVLQALSLKNYKDDQVLHEFDRMGIRSDNFIQIKDNFYRPKCDRFEKLSRQPSEIKYTINMPTAELLNAEYLTWDQLENPAFGEMENGVIIKVGFTVENNKTSKREYKCYKYCKEIKSPRYTYSTLFPKLSEKFGTNQSVQITHRQNELTNFQDGNADALFISNHYGTEGLNLTKANHVFFLDIAWTAKDMDQAVGRVWRLGQEKNCYVYLPVTVNTPERNRFRYYNRKRQFSAEFIDKYRSDHDHNIVEANDAPETEPEKDDFSSPDAGDFLSKRDQAQQMQFSSFTSVEKDDTVELTLPFVPFAVPKESICSQRIIFNPFNSDQADEVNFATFKENFQVKKTPAIVYKSNAWIPGEPNEVKFQIFYHIVLPKILKTCYYDSILGQYICGDLVSNEKPKFWPQNHPSKPDPWKDFSTSLKHNCYGLTTDIVVNDPETLKFSTRWKHLKENQDKKLALRTIQSDGERKLPNCPLINLRSCLCENTHQKNNEAKHAIFCLLNTSDFLESFQHGHSLVHTFIHNVRTIHTNMKMDTGYLSSPNSYKIASYGQTLGGKAWMELGDDFGSIATNLLNMCSDDFRGKFMCKDQNSEDFLPTDQSDGNKINRDNLENGLSKIARLQLSIADGIQCGLYYMTDIHSPQYWKLTQYFEAMINSKGKIIVISLEQLVESGKRRFLTLAWGNADNDSNSKAIWIMTHNGNLVLVTSRSKRIRSKITWNHECKYQKNTKHNLEFEEKFRVKLCIFKNENQ